MNKRGRAPAALCPPQRSAGHRTTAAARFDFPHVPPPESQCTLGADTSISSQLYALAHCTLHQFGGSAAVPPACVALVSPCSLSIWPLQTAAAPNKRNKHPALHMCTRSTTWAQSSSAQASSPLGGASGGSHQAWWHHRGRSRATARRHSRRPLLLQQLPAAAGCQAERRSGEDQEQVGVWGSLSLASLAPQGKANPSRSIQCAPTSPHPRIPGHLPQA